MTSQFLFFCASLPALGYPKFWVLIFLCGFSFIFFRPMRNWHWQWQVASKVWKEKARFFVHPTHTHTHTHTHTRNHTHTQPHTHTPSLLLVNACVITAHTTSWQRWIFYARAVSENASFCVRRGGAWRWTDRAGRPPRR